MLKKYVLDIQNFAEESSQLGAAVVGHRTWFLESSPVPTKETLSNPVIGLRSTPDLGSAQNTVEANTLDGIREKNVPGYYPASDVEYTLLLGKKTLENQLEYVNKEVWVYEEHENMTSTPDKIGWGITYKIKVSGVTATGQSPEGLLEMTQSGTLLSDEYYYAKPTYGSSGDEPTWTFKGMQTGKAVQLNELQTIALQGSNPVPVSTKGSLKD